MLGRQVFGTRVPSSSALQTGMSVRRRSALRPESRSPSLPGVDRHVLELVRMLPRGRVRGGVLVASELESDDNIAMTEPYHQFAGGSIKPSPARLTHDLTRLADFANDGCNATKRNFSRVPASED